VPPARHELGRVAKLNAGAIGPPGQRHFHIQVEAQGGRVVIWLEKAQLFNLAMAAKRLLDAASKIQPAQDPPSPDDIGSLSLDFKVDQLFLDPSPEQGLYVLGAREVSDEESDEAATASFQASHDQLQALVDEALEVCAAGRPACPLCGEPMDPGGHACVRSNGHVARETR
jgi:uncharacterized repeat protein (TIGR03847 family)